MTMGKGASNRLFYGDNLDVLRQHIASESVDLVYLDPPFNSNRNYSVIFSRNGRTDTDNTAQIQAFEDTWHWTQATEQQYLEFIATARGAAADALVAFRGLLGENDASAYLVNMAPRLQELHRVLKPTGSLYLHCDPTMSHYLKILLDAIFGVENFRNEVIWKRTGAHGSAKRYAPIHDVILLYSVGPQFTWNKQLGGYDPEYIAQKFAKRDVDGRLFQDISLTGPGTRSGESGLPWRDVNVTATGRHWALPGWLEEQGIVPKGRTLPQRLDALDAAGRVYWTRNGQPRLKFFLDDMGGMALSDVWTDTAPINSQAAERLGYPTQKPLALLERIISASSNPGDVVLDPFCGCGTTVDAAQKLGRPWVGIDITYIAVDLILKRLEHSHGPSVLDSIDVNGIPYDFASAAKLFERSPFDFERWAVSLVGAEPNQRQVGDKGIDGVARFPLDAQRKQLGKVLVSVKGGKTVPPTFVRDLLGTVQQTPGATMGVLITMEPLTPGSREVIDHSGSYSFPVNGQSFPVLQHVTVRDLLAGRRPAMPPTLLPYIQAQRAGAAGTAEALF